MKRKTLFLILILLIAGASVVWYLTHRSPPVLSLTGIVSTDEVVVSSQVSGRLSQLKANVGDAVKAGQLLAVILRLLPGAKE